LEGGENACPELFPNAVLPLIDKRTPGLDRSRDARYYLFSDDVKEMIDTL
jgi:hypothetical protein